MNKRHHFRDLGAYSLWALAMLVFALVIWATWLRIRYPYDGVMWSNKSGLVTRVDPSGPAAGILQKEDRVLAIDGRLFYQASPLYSGNEAGDIVTFSIQRQGIHQDIDLSLTMPSRKALFAKSIPLLVAFFFWAVAILFLSFQYDHLQTQFFALICLLCTRWNQVQGFSKLFHLWCSLWLSRLLLPSTRWRWAISSFRFGNDWKHLDLRLFQL